MSQKRCLHCKFHRVYGANGCWTFIGCRHSPYSGKWVAEIETCPLTDDEVMQLEDDTSDEMFW